MSSLIKAEEVRALVGNIPLYEWAKNGIVPIAETAGSSRYYLAYFQKLHRLARGYKPTRLHATLCTIEWQADLGDASALDRFDELRAAHEVYVSAEVSALMGYDQRTINKWKAKGFLSTIVISGCHFFIARDVLALKKVMDGYTSYEASEVLGCALGTVNRLARDGKLGATMTPCGWRFDVKSVHAFSITPSDHRAKPLAGWFSTFEASQTLGIPVETFENWIREGIVAASKIDGYLYFSKEEILRIKAERDVLRGGFEALQSVQTEGAHYYAPKQVADRLRISSHSVMVWTAEGLLPYYDRSPQQLARQQGRMYLGWYVDALVQYAESCEQRPSKALARAFKEWAIDYYSP